jgi:hypothetical protein
VAIGDNWLKMKPNYIGIPKLAVAVSGRQPQKITPTHHEHEANWEIPDLYLL